MKKNKIVVIGAGLAGLTLGYRLHMKGCDFELYEAKKRLGGRVFSVYLNGAPFELGGQNILDGGEAKHMLSLISEMGLEVEGGKTLLHVDHYDGEKIIDPNPRLKKYNFNPSNLKEKLAEIGKSASTMDDVLKALFYNDEVLYQTFYVRLSGYEGMTPEFLSLANITTLHHMLLGGLSSAHPSDGREDVYIDYLSVKGGNSLLVNKLADKLSNRIHTDEPLTSLSKDLEGLYVLNFKSGKRITADLVVLTIPCPVFNDISIDVIPQEKLNSIRSIQYGTNSKIGVSLEPPYPQASYTNNKRMICFRQGKGPLLTLYYIGNLSKFNENTIQDTFNKDLPFIQKAYHLPLKLEKPVMAQDKSFAAYEGPVGFSWPNDPYAKGSYSALAIGQEKKLTELTQIAGEKVKTLFSPIDESLFFAGEHTSILLDVGGTMEAAIESGERAFRLICKL